MQRRRGTLCSLPTECQPPNTFYGVRSYMLTGADDSRLQAWPRTSTLWKSGVGASATFGSL
eukprot:8153719-Alexandrium_andersonii.AAC.1